jgi:hypothetical protein
VSTAQRRQLGAAPSTQEDFPTTQNELFVWEAIMFRRTKVAFVMVVIAMLATIWGMLGNAVAQKAAVPKSQDKLATGEDEAKQLLLLVDTRQERKGLQARVDEVHGSGVRQTG